MVKLLIETGSGSHTTSSASCVVKFVEGAYAGQHLYQQKKFQVGSPVWDTAKTNEKWVETVYDLPNGTLIEIVGNGRTGNRGSTKHAFHKVYRLDESAEVIEDFADVGLRNCVFKGRLVLVNDVLEEKAEKAAKVREEDF